MGDLPKVQQTQKELSKTKGSKYNIDMIKIIYEYETPDYEFYKTVNPIDLLKEEINLLSYNYKTSLQMYYFERKMIKEIAKELEVSENTIKLRMHKAKGKLKKNILRKYPNFTQFL